jgi:hypothetical protein
MEGAIRRVALGVVLLVAFACSGSDDAEDGSACPEGTTRWERMEGLDDGTAADTRDEAISAELEAMGREASDEAISAAVVGSSPGSNGGEMVEVETADGVIVTMTLVAQNPGWRVERSTWCAPGDQ